MAVKYIVPTAAFILLVGATAASAATGSDWMKNLNLTDAQKSALEEVRSIREEAHERAQDVLENAGIDAAKMREIHEAMREGHHESHEAIRSAIENNDYSAFTEAAKDTPLGEVVDTQDEFAKLVEAHELRASGDHDGAHEIMEGLGLKGGGKGGKGYGMGRGMGHNMGYGEGEGR